MAVALLPKLLKIFHSVFYIWSTADCLLSKLSVEKYMNANVALTNFRFNTDLFQCTWVTVKHPAKRDSLSPFGIFCRRG